MPKSERTIAALRTTAYTLLSVFVAFDYRARIRLDDWYRSGPTCPALEPGDERRARHG